MLPGDEKRDAKYTAVLIDGEGHAKKPLERGGGKKLLDDGTRKEGGVQKKRFDKKGVVFNWHQRTKI